MNSVKKIFLVHIIGLTIYFLLFLHLDNAPYLSLDESQNVINAIDKDQNYDYFGRLINGKSDNL